MLDEKWSQIFGQNVEILAIAHGVSNEVIIFDAVHFLLLARLIIKSMLYYKKMYYNSTNDPRKGETKHKKTILGVNNGCAFTEK